MTDLKASRTADQIERMIDEAAAAMADHQKNSSYVEAENSRLFIEQLKKDLQARRIYEMEMRHSREVQDLIRAQNEETKNFNSFWEKRLYEYDGESVKLVKDMESKHSNELESTKNQLERQLPYKVKESSECLNLRKMEQYMAKQKNFVEAHRVQQRIAQIQAEQKQEWIINRNLKIQTALNTLRGKQTAELANLQKKIKTGLEEITKQKLTEENRINLKYGNLQRQLKSNQDKEILAYRGQFRSKGGQGSPLLTKSKFLSSR